MVLKILSTAIRRQKERNSVQFGKEVKLSLFAENMILYIENPEVSTKKLLGQINEFSKVAEFSKVTRLIYRNLLLFIKMIMKYQKDKLKKQFYLQSHQEKEKSKTPRKNLNQEGKILNSETHKILIKEFQGDSKK